MEREVAVAKVENVKAVTDALGKRAREAKDVSVLVGYTQNYALFVHEDLEAHHPVGQAKFLEQPARERGKEIGRVIREAYRKTRNMAQSLLLGGLFLQRESQKLVPVDTGALKNSAFTRLDEGG